MNCGPCSLDLHDSCYWHEGDDCDCPCHEGWERIEVSTFGAAEPHWYVSPPHDPPLEPA